MVELVLETNSSKFFKYTTGYVILLKEGSCNLKVFYDSTQEDCVDITIAYQSKEKRDVTFIEMSESKIMSFISALSL